MKKLLALGTLLSIICLPISAQKHSLYYNALGNLNFNKEINFYSVTYEQALGGRISAAVGLAYGTFGYKDAGKASPLFLEWLSYKGYSITPELRYYPFGGEDIMAPLGYFISAYFKYASLKESYYKEYIPGRGAIEELTELDSYLLSYGAATGYKFGLSPFSIEVLFGMGSLDQNELGRMDPIDEGIADVVKSLRYRAEVSIGLIF